MAFLVYPEDYKIASRDEVVKAIVRQDLTAIELAANAAVEEMWGYLSGRFDVDAIFAAVGAARNTLLVMFGADIALYHLYSGLSKQQMPEEKKARYDRAIEWLQGVRSGDIEPKGLPVKNNATTGETDISNPVQWGSTENNSSW